MKASKTSASSSPATNAVHQHPYMHLVHHVSVASAALGKDQAELAALVALPTLTERQEKRLRAICKKMDSIEKRLVGKLNPDSCYAAVN
jgi:hypothetical protein